MRFILLLLAIFLTACAAPSETASPQTPAPQTVGDHIPPPGFPVRQAPAEGERFCGGMTAVPAQTCEEPREYCHREIEDICGFADAPGICRVKPQICPQNYAPVCGCDGKTYSNACVANSNGVSAMSKGECKTP